MIKLSKKVKHMSIDGVFIHNLVNELKIIEKNELIKFMI